MGPRFETTPRRRWPLAVLALLLAALWLAAAFELGRRGLRPAPLSDVGKDAGGGARATLPAPETPTSESAPHAPVRVYFSPSPPGTPAGPAAQLLALLARARESVLCAWYDLELDAAAEALVALHRRGVRVGLVSDSDYRSRAAMKTVLEAGVPVVFDDSSGLMHNKFCVVDGQMVWTGSTNITNNCLFRNNNNALLLVSPELAENYAAEFNEMFSLRRFGPGPSKPTPHPVVNIGGVRVECYFAPEDRALAALLRTVGGAADRIDFMAFSFTSTELAEAMAARMGNGVRVRGLFERRGAGGAHPRDDWLAARGAEIHLDANPGTMHHKVIIVDAAVVAAGSYNFSRNAETRNDENLLILHDTALAGQYLDEMDRLVAEAAGAKSPSVNR
ncbi:MAG: hypothetical protein H3C30_00980 [Candidatus Hydrogenedentes bacterium]|nr:hypothetical protein [Candidatus Hydrogenedentota bacterium]